jgi:hypothetical protein
MPQWYRDSCAVKGYLVASLSLVCYFFSFALSCVYMFSDFIRNFFKKTDGMGIRTMDVQEMYRRVLPPLDVGVRLGARSRENHTNLHWICW